MTLRCNPYYCASLVIHLVLLGLYRLLEKKITWGEKRLAVEAEAFNIEFVEGGSIINLSNHNLRKKGVFVRSSNNKKIGISFINLGR